MARASCAAAALLLAIALHASAADTSGWRLQDRFAAFRFECEGQYDARRFALAVRDKADELSGFGASPQRVCACRTDAHTTWRVQERILSRPSR